MNKSLKTISDGMASVVEAASATTVQVSGRRRQPASGVIWSADGYIITAAHVLPRKHAPKVMLEDGSEHDAQVVGHDMSTDLALLKVEASGLAVPTWASIDDVKVGQMVMAVARPTKGVQATMGIISAKAGGWRTGAGGGIDHYIQTDVLMYPGFSGGPLAAVNGSFVGLNSSALARGVSVTVPPTTLERVANSLLAHGEVKRGYLGIKTQPVRLPEAISKEIGQESGLLLAGVEPGGPAETSGLLVGDIIVTFNDKVIRQPDDLLAELASIPSGQKNPARIVRGGQLNDVQVTAGAKA